MKAEWENRTVCDMFSDSVQRFGKRTALVNPRGRWTYRELDRITNQFAKGLSNLGVRKGDKVGFLMGNREEWVFTLLGTLKLGAIVVPLNVTLQTEELKYAISRTDISTLVIQDTFRDRELLKLLSDMCPEFPDSQPGQLESAAFPLLKNVIVLSPSGRTYDRTFAFEQVMQSGANYTTAEVSEWRARIEPTDPAFFMLTSGSTARPKVVINSHNSFVYVAAGHADALRMTEEDRFMGIAPNYHNAGTMTMLTTFLRGAEFHIIDFYSPEGANAAIESGGCTTMFGFDIHLRMMKDSPRYHDYDISSLKRTMLGSNPAVYDQIADMGIIHQGNIYGCSEGASTVCVLPMGATTDYEILKYCHGRPLSHTEVKVVNPETGQRCAPDEPGEICFRGPNLFSGYYKDPEATAKDMDEEGYFHTGDYGWLDAKGYIYYRGRYKQMVKTGGENVSQREVELFLEDQCPWIKTAQVVGVPDPMWGEAVTAMVELVPGAQTSSEELREWCKGKLANFKIPKHFLFVTATEWPITPTGKFDKFAIRDKAIKYLADKETDPAQTG